MTSWRTASLVELGRIVTGKTPPTSDSNNYGGDIPFVTPTDMDGRRSIQRTLRYLTQSGVASVASSLLTEPSVAVSCIGSDMGKAVMLPAGSVTNQQINSIIVNDIHDRLFVYYNLYGRRDEIRNQAGGAAQPILNKTDFGRLPILLPDHDEQIRISAVLGALDDKIDLIQRMNETLGAMARAIFKEWFVDFGPVRAKMEGRDPPGLAPEIAALFPGQMGDDGLPEGWGSGPLSSLIRQTTAGVSPEMTPTKLFLHYSLPAFDMGQQPVQEFGLAIKSNKTVVPQGAILMSKLNPAIPRVWLVDDQAGDRICSTEFLVYTPVKAALRSFSYCQLLEAGFRQRLEGMVIGTSNSHQRVSPGSILAVEIVLPSEKITLAFHDVAGSLLERVQMNRAESQTLAALRDLLLPKLMSGELRVRDAEKLVERAA